MVSSFLFFSSSSSQFLLFPVSDCLDSVMDVLDSMSWGFATAGFGDCLCGGCSSFPVVTFSLPLSFVLYSTFFFFFGMLKLSVQKRGVFRFGLSSVKMTIH